MSLVIDDFSSIWQIKLVFLNKVVCLYYFSVNAVN